jgi:protein-tyrosine phosphatase
LIDLSVSGKKISLLDRRCRMQKHHDRPVPNAYWVRPGKLLAGEYPRTIDNKSSRIKLGQLLEAGVTFFLDLTEAGEYHLKSYAGLLRQEATARKQTVEYRRMSIRDRGTPTPAEMKRILDTIDAELAAGRVVYVHCFGGIGRTGTVVGCHLVRRGLSGEAALAEITRLRRGTPTEWQPSPETEAQEQMVRDWSKGQ